MKTKKKPFEKPLPGFRETAEEVAERETAEGKEPDAGKRERFNLSFDLNEDGSPDLSSMRGRTKERAAAFFSDAKIAAAFGAKPAATPATNLFPMGPEDKYPAMIGSFYNTLGMIESMLAQKFGKIPTPIAERVFAYSEQEKILLAPPTVKVLNKYAPEWLIKYQDEIALANLFLTITAAKIVAARVLTAQMQNPGSGNIPPNGSQAKTDESGEKGGAGTEGPIQ